jgi:hypothetical protein
LLKNQPARTEARFVRIESTFTLSRQSSFLLAQSDVCLFSVSDLGCIGDLGEKTFYQTGIGYDPNPPSVAHLANPGCLR